MAEVKALFHEGYHVVSQGYIGHVSLKDAHFTVTGVKMDYASVVHKWMLGQLEHIKTANTIVPTKEHNICVVRPMLTRAKL